MKKFLIFATMLFALPSAADTVTVCSQANTTYNITGSAAQATRDKLENAANFGAGGAFCEHDFQFVTVGNNFTEASINAADCDIWWSGYENNSSYSATESSELLSWLDNGGHLVAGCDDVSHNPVCTLLGFTLDGTNVANGNSVVQPAVAGCFPNTPLNVPNGGGAVTSFSEDFGSLVISEQQQVTGPSVIYTETMFVSTDINMIVNDGNCCLTNGAAITNANDQFLGDVMCTLGDSATRNGNCFLCGNNEVNLVEGCDDGDTNNGDGCNDACFVEDGFACNTSNAGQTNDASCASNVCDATSGNCEPADTCGNGRIEAGEGCDDGGVADGDGCSANCLVENGALCNNSGAGLEGDASCVTGVCIEVGNTCSPAVIAADDSATLAEDNPTFIDVEDNDFADGSPTTITIGTPPAHGDATVVNGQVLYVPDEDFTGPDTFTYNLCNDANPQVCDEGTVSVNVTAINDPPVALDDDETMNEDSGPVAFNVLANDSDPDDVQLTASVPATSTAGGTTLIDADGNVQYNPPANFNGTDTVTVTVCDDENACVDSLLTIEVAPIADPPVAVDDSADVIEDTPTDIVVLDDDVDPDGDVLVVSAPPTSAAGGTVSINANGTVRYTPPRGLQWT